MEKEMKYKIEIREPYKCFYCKCTPCCTPELCNKMVSNLFEKNKKEQFEHKQKKLKEAIEILCNALKEDKILFKDWETKLTNSFNDQLQKDDFEKAFYPGAAISIMREEVFETCQKAAKNFLNLLISK